MSGTRQWWLGLGTLYPSAIEKRGCHCSHKLLLSDITKHKIPCTRFLSGLCAVTRPLKWSQNLSAALRWVASSIFWLSYSRHLIKIWLIHFRGQSIVYIYRRINIYPFPSPSPISFLPFFLHYECHWDLILNITRCTLQMSMYTSRRS